MFLAPNLDQKVAREGLDILDSLGRIHHYMPKTQPRQPGCYRSESRSVTSDPFLQNSRHL